MKEPWLTGIRKGLGRMRPPSLNVDYVSDPPEIRDSESWWDPDVSRAEPTIEQRLEEGLVGDVKINKKRLRLEERYFAEKREKRRRRRWEKRIRREMTQDRS